MRMEYPKTVSKTAYHIPRNTVSTKIRKKSEARRVETSLHVSREATYFSPSGRLGELWRHRKRWPSRRIAQKIVCAKSVAMDEARVTNERENERPAETKNTKCDWEEKKVAGWEKRYSRESTWRILATVLAERMEKNMANRIIVTRLRMPHFLLSNCEAKTAAGMWVGDPQQKTTRKTSGIDERVPSPARADGVCKGIMREPTMAKQINAPYPRHMNIDSKTLSSTVLFG